jgi:chorismate dehydratase
MPADMHRIAMVNYLNTAPMLEGIQRSLSSQVDMLLAHPADCARLFWSGEVDYGLVPVGALVGQAGWRQIADIGIACDGEVKTVCLFGHTPMEEWRKLYLDDQSRTSVLLTKMLLASSYRHIDLVPAPDKNYFSHIQGDTGGLVIGDRAITAAEQFPYCYDLGAWWKQETGLPFVFAIWVGHADQEDPAFEHDLRQALSHGVQDVDPSIQKWQPHYPLFDLNTYYNRYIQYRLNNTTSSGLQLFMDRAIRIHTS